MEGSYIATNIGTECKSLARFINRVELTLSLQQLGRIDCRLYQQ